jgi:hypothetical protein
VNARPQVREILIALSFNAGQRLPSALSSICVARLQGLERTISVCFTATEKLRRRLACTSGRRSSESFEMHVHASCADCPEGFEGYHLFATVTEGA